MDGKPALRAEREPALLRREPAPAARAGGRRHGALVHPGPAGIAVDARGGEIADPFQPRHGGDGVAVAVERGIARLVGRDGEKDMGRACQHPRRMRERCRALERHGVDARCRERPAPGLRPAGAGEREAGRAQQRAEALRREAVAEAEEPLAAGRHRGPGRRRAGPAPFVQHRRVALGRREAGAERVVVGLRREPGGRPDRHGAHQRRGVREQPPGGRPDRRIAAIADGDQHVADEAIAPDPLDRAAGEDRPEGAVVEPGEVGEPWRRQLRARQEGVLLRAPCVLVPRADGEAVVAAVDAVAHGARNAGAMWPLCSIVR